MLTVIAPWPHWYDLHVWLIVTKMAMAIFQFMRAIYVETSVHTHLEMKSSHWSCGCDWHTVLYWKKAANGQSLFTSPLILKLKLMHYAHFSVNHRDREHTLPFVNGPSASKCVFNDCWLRLASSEKTNLTITRATARVTRLQFLLLQYDGAEIWTEVNSGFFWWVQIIDTSCMNGIEMRCQMAGNTL